MTVGEGVGLRVVREARGRVTGDGVELAYGFWPGRGMPIVAIHALTTSYKTFVGIGERLAGRRPLFAPDLRGRGDSDKPAGPYGMAAHAADVAAAMRAIGIGPSVVVGHSMG
ncbi:MAG: alpha/beta fold hydrolase, partial [Acidimicrobiia bacterium]